MSRARQTPCTKLTEPCRSWGTIESSYQVHCAMFYPRHCRHAPALKEELPHEESRLEKWRAHNQRTMGRCCTCAPDRIGSDSACTIRESEQSKNVYVVIIHKEGTSYTPGETLSRKAAIVSAIAYKRPALGCDVLLFRCFHRTRSDPAVDKCVLLSESESEKRALRLLAWPFPSCCLLL